MTTPSTQIRLSPQGGLELVLPDGRGGERLLALPEGEAEGALRRLLRAQQRDARIGTEGPATYTFLLHLSRHGYKFHSGCVHCQREGNDPTEDFVAKGGQITVVPQGRLAPAHIHADANPEDLGL